PRAGCRSTSPTPAAGHRGPAASGRCPAGPAGPAHPAEGVSLTQPKTPVLTSAHSDGQDLLRGDPQVGQPGTPAGGPDPQGTGRRDGCAAVTARDNSSLGTVPPPRSFHRSIVAAFAAPARNRELLPGQRLVCGVERGEELPDGGPGRQGHDLDRP